MTYEETALKDWLSLTRVLIRGKKLLGQHGTAGGGNGMQGKRKWQMIQKQHEG